MDKPSAKKTVLIGVTGGVAAYKTCEIARNLQKKGIRVKIVMTESATHFINPTLFRALTREPVAVGTFDDRPGDPIHHISLAKEADLFLIAPCTANVMAKLAHGIADNLLTTTALATKAPIVIAPAMNVTMYNAPATQENIRILKERGIGFIEPDEGYLACGDTGKGRLADPAFIAESVCEMLDIKRDLEGKAVLITAGPTIEPIDPVRYISNPSSGKMGYAIAEEAVARGARVELITGPVALADPAGAETTHVKTAVEMFNAVDALFDSCDIAFFTAAVCDMRPATVAEKKLKKGTDDAALAHIDMVANPDILATMGARSHAGQTVVGFAAETDDVAANARLKLVQKHADMIVGNKVGSGIGFGSDVNEAVLVTADGAENLPCMSKRALAKALVDKVLAL